MFYGRFPSILIPSKRIRDNAVNADEPKSIYAGVRIVIQEFQIMMEWVLYLCPILSFVTTWIAIRKWIRIAPEIGLLGLDMNKPGKPKVAEMGGICVVFGFVLGLLVNIGIMTFYLGSSSYAGILAVLCTVLIISIIGIMDDLLGWKKGLKQWQKPILTLFAAMPMMVINAGHSSMALPIVGIIDWGILYPLTDSSHRDSRRFERLQYASWI